MSDRNSIYQMVENFGDPKAKIREGINSTTGNLQISVLYGGIDGGDSEGHGHFIAEEIDGFFQVILDRHPDKVDGGRHEIEVWLTGDEDEEEKFKKNRPVKYAYNNESRLDRIQKKRDVIRRVSYLSYDDPFCAKKLNELKDEFINIGSCGSADNQILWQEFNEAKNHFVQEFNERIAQQKEGIISRAQSIAYVSDLRNSRDEMNRLFEDWKKIPRMMYAKDKEDDLWNRFNRIRTEFRNKQKAEREKREALQQEGRMKKEAIVSRAESLVYSNDLQMAKKEMKSLMDQWKAAPRASRQDEEKLWERFRIAKDTLYNRAKQEYEKRQEEQNAAKMRKERIISQAEALCNASDYRDASEQMKALSQQFYDAGNAGKDNQDLKNRFNSAKERFYAAKKLASEQKHREYIQRMQERLFAKREQLSRVEESIRRTESYINDIMYRPEPSYTNPHRYEIVARKNQKISNLNEKLRSLGERRQQLINQIMDIQSKMNS